ncbi:endonuclease/exonuclease/phosphatase family protein [Stutzerimonas stutzeri]|uniref:endonuclease/exonuclease/phosphatase family protein n=1 Tax=Stutzerimonas sp. S1 TaxID=3030652 RepID=UPI002224E16B|nr:endonuclease/exonuclease/phosphatase family protein [Stutzerimonas sp. S1]MCW3147819.1 endonuclease/exonuclease/phosphatase family protein [Stutzerimonas sp. S1]
MTEGILLAATLFFVLISLLPHWDNPVWWVRVWEFPRLQASAALLVLLAAQGLLLNFTQPWHFALPMLGLSCLAYQLWWIAPYTRLWPKEVQSAQADAHQPHIRVIAANVLAPNRQASRLLELVWRHQPDVLVTLETDHWWEAQLDGLAEHYPYSIRCPLENLYGMHVFSRLPLEDPQLRFLVEADVPSMHARVRVSDELSVRMHFLHPAPPSPTENAESTERDVELLVVAKSLQDDHGPIIVTGDLNDVAWSPTTRLFRKISGLLDPRVGRGMFNSFHARLCFMRWPLDHFFHSAHFRLVSLTRLPRFGSDHFAMLIELQYDPRHAATQQGLEADRDDEQLAREKTADEAASAEDVPHP